MTTRVIGLIQIFFWPSHSIFAHLFSLRALVFWLFALCEFQLIFVELQADWHWLHLALICSDSLGQLQLVLHMLPTPYNRLRTVWQMIHQCYQFKFQLNLVSAFFVCPCQQCREYLRVAWCQPWIDWHNISICNQHSQCQCSVGFSLKDVWKKVPRWMQRLQILFCFSRRFLRV